jgi:hypothetical protein
LVKVLVAHSYGMARVQPDLGTAKPPSPLRGSDVRAAAAASAGTGHARERAGRRRRMTDQPDRTRDPEPSASELEDGGTEQTWGQGEGAHQPTIPTDEEPGAADPDPTAERK